MEKKHTDAEQQVLYDQLNKELGQRPSPLKKSAYFNGTQASLARLQERYEELDKRLTELELYCYETDEVGYTISWYPKYCVPRQTQLQREIAIWRMMNPIRRPVEEVAQAVDKRKKEPFMFKGTRDDPIVLSD